MLNSFRSRTAGFVIPLLLVASTYSHAQEEKKESDDLNISLRADCLHSFNIDKGSTQDCIGITGLRLQAKRSLSSRLEARFSLDPFATPVLAYATRPDLSRLPATRDTDFGLISDYALIWRTRPNLQVAIQKYSAAGFTPSISGLAFGGRLASTGWDQTALTVTYDLAALRELQVQFAAGNGEGENGKNSDSQQFFGVGVSANVGTGMTANVGLSLDGNSFGSQHTEWQQKYYQEQCGLIFVPNGATGHSTQRMNFGLTLDGTQQTANGLQAALSYQLVTMTDLDKDSMDAPDFAELRQCNYDIDNLFVEDVDGDKANTVDHSIISISAAYRLIERLQIAFDFNTRKIDSGSVEAFVVCDKFDEIKCTSTGDASSQLNQSAITLGGNYDLDDSLKLGMEYHRSYFDKKYQNAYFVGKGDKATDIEELFNVRVAYNW